MTDDDLWTAFKAGFDASGEGYNGEYGADKSSIRRRFEIWQCDGHEYGEWEFVRDNGFGDRTLYRRHCKHCPDKDAQWTDGDSP